jgi:hypothetical protein
MKFEALESETSELEKRHLQELALAYASGLFTLVAGLAVFRVCARSTSLFSRKDRLAVRRMPFESAQEQGLATMADRFVD